MKKKYLKGFRRAVLRDVKWLHKYDSKRGTIEVGISGDGNFEVTKGDGFLEIRDKISLYRFRK